MILQSPRHHRWVCKLNTEQNSLKSLDFQWFYFSSSPARVDTCTQTIPTTLVLESSRNLRASPKRGTQERKKKEEFHGTRRSWVDGYKNKLERMLPILCHQGNAN